MTTLDYTTATFITETKEMHNKEETFKDIPGFPKYQVSDLGNVKSFKVDKEKGRILRPGSSYGGYPVVLLML